MRAIDQFDDDINSRSGIAKSHRLCGRCFRRSEGDREDKEEVEIVFCCQLLIVNCPLHPARSLKKL